jgi:diaminopimelate decarboxylase
LGEGILTGPFARADGHLLCGAVPAAEIAERFGTPLFVYDIGHITERVRAFGDAFADVDHLIAYSVKANGNLSILRRLAELGCGADVTSGGELFRARKAGIPAERIVFAGVGKSRDEIRAALREGIYAFNVESRGELERLDALAGEVGIEAPFGVRVNPDVLAATPHAYTRTGHAESKFGVPWDETRALYEWARCREHLRPLGIDAHIGSQIVDTAPYLNALGRVLELVGELAMIGIELEFLDLGGGYGISYDGMPALDIVELAGLISPRVASLGLRLILEPGRSLVGEAGVMLTRVEYVKRTGKKTFVVVDGGMTELIRPSHYGGYHTIERVGPPSGEPAQPVDVVGPICETGDFLALDRTIEVPEPGELLAVRTVGAYGFTMASNYNGRLRPAEAMVEGSEVTLIRRRETLEDLIRGEE